MATRHLNIGGACFSREEPDMESAFTNTEKAAEARREVAMRKEVYSRAAGGTLRPAQARRLAMMEEIAAEYEALAEKERLI